MLELTRPIAFVDIESTGVSATDDKIIELAIIKLHPDMNRTAMQWRFNPGMPIPAGATAIHHITDADVATEPKFSVMAQEVHDYLSGCDLGGFNSSRFDFPLLYNEFARCGIIWDYLLHNMVDAGNIFKIKEQRTLSAAMQFYCNAEIEGAHGAMADISATVDVFLAQLERYPNLPADVSELALFSNYGKPILDMSGKFTTNESGDIVFNFGQKIGLVALDNMEYIDWMYNRASFAPDTRAVCEKVLDLYDQREKQRAAQWRAAAVARGDDPNDDLPF